MLKAFCEASRSAVEPMAKTGKVRGPGCGGAVQVGEGWRGSGKEGERAGLGEGGTDNSLSWPTVDDAALFAQIAGIWG